MKEMIFVLGSLALMIFIVAVGPLLTIWSLNTLFPALAIPYAIDTWAAVVLIGLFIRAKVGGKKND